MPHGTAHDTNKAVSDCRPKTIGPWSTRLTFAMIPISFLWAANSGVRSEWAVLPDAIVVFVFVFELSLQEPIFWLMGSIRRC